MADKRAGREDCCTKQFVIHRTHKTPLNVTRLVSLFETLPIIGLHICSKKGDLQKWKGIMQKSLPQFATDDFQSDEISLRSTAVQQNAIRLRGFEWEQDTIRCAADFMRWNWIRNVLAPVKSRFYIWCRDSCQTVKNQKLHEKTHR